MYKTNELNTTIGGEIDLVYVGESGGLSFFEGGAPTTALTNWDLSNIPSGKNTEIVNDLSITTSGVRFSVADFDGMANDDNIKNLIIAKDNNSFSVSDVPLIVVFKTSTNKKGAIKVKSGVSGRNGHVVCDIKVQK